MKHITKPKFVNLEVSYPTDLDEQDAIAARLREQIAAADRAREAMSRQTEATRALVGALIDEAVSTHLTDLGRFGEVLTRPATSGWSPACDDLAGGTPVLSLTSVTGFQFRPDALKLTSEPVDREAKYWAHNGDLFISRSNTLDLVGHVAIASGLSQAVIFPDLLMRLEIDRNKFDPEFVYIWLMSKSARTHIRKEARGSSGTMKKINQGIISAIPFPTGLDLATQKALVNSVRPLLASARRATEAAAEGADAAAALPSSIVREAFRVGNLEVLADD